MDSSVEWPEWKPERTSVIQSMKSHLTLLKRKSWFAALRGLLTGKILPLAIGTAVTYGVLEV